MSLINDALKKTQHMRSDPASDGAPVAGGYNGPRRGNAGPSMTLMIVGAVVLVAIAICGTVLLLKSKSGSSNAGTSTAALPSPIVLSPAPQPAPVSITPAPTAANVAAAPLIVAPVLTVPKSTSAEPKTTVAAVTPAPESATPSAPAAALINPAAKAKVDVATFIDAIHVTGVRFSDGSSKVLMNDHVYKVNDIVERVLNIRLVEVNNDSLTFVDENGAVYKKNF